MSKAKSSTKKNNKKFSAVNKKNNKVDLFKIFTAEELEYRAELCPKCKTF